MAYQGHRNWTVWNVNLWVSNDEYLYDRAMEVCGKQGKDQAGLLASLMKELLGKTTPDNAQLRFMDSQDWKELAESLKE